MMGKFISTAVIFKNGYYKIINCGSRPQKYKLSFDLQILIELSFYITIISLLNLMAVPGILKSLFSLF